MKNIRKPVRKSIKKPAAYKSPAISTTLATETVLARMIDLVRLDERVAVMVEYLKGTDRKFQSAVLARMTRDSAAMLLHAAGAVDKPVMRGLPSVQTECSPPVESNFGPATEPATEPVVETVVHGVESEENNTDHYSETVSAVVGPYSSRWSADQDAAQFMHPKIMLYRSTTFPPPSTHGVSATVVSSTVVEVKDLGVSDKRSASLKRAYPFAIQLTTEVNGDKTKVQKWVAAFTRLNHFTKVA